MAPYMWVRRTRSAVAAATSASVAPPAASSAAARASSPWPMVSDRLSSTSTGMRSKAWAAVRADW